MTRVLVTGATGFIGTALVPLLARAGFHVIAALRRPLPDLRLLAEPHVVGEIGPSTRWSEVLNGVSAVVHVAGPAHGRNEGGVEPSAWQWRGGAIGTRVLAQAAAEAGVRRFVFISSVKAAGERTDGEPWRESDQPAPQDGYGRAKLAGERALMECARNSALEPTILRPPLVHGPGVKANVLALLRCMQAGIPLPLADIHNRRSIISIHSLVDAVMTVLIHPRAAGQTYYVRDGDLSTFEIAHALARGAGLTPKFYRAPPPFLRFAAQMIGRGEVAARLLDSLVVNDDKIRLGLGWMPRTDASAALAATGAWFAHQR
ncbi:MAG: NAD-dependent epimerase/dehydratase family protein [Proteobacteria bacterium]|nr:NAD-dependent epimerase/dehydratase family protein [Pseudomonadota bacterium]